MPRFVLKFVIGALALWVSTKVVQGVGVDGTDTLIVAAILMGMANAVVRPALVLLTLPLTIVSLGLFLFVVNGAAISLVDWILPGMKIDDFGHAMLAALVVWIISWAGEMLLGVRTRQTEIGA
jgi:putative membrane protein